MTRPFFVRDRIRDFDIFEEHATRAISKMKARLEEGYAFDFQDLAARFTLDSASEFLCGFNIDSLSATLKYPPSSAIAGLRNAESALHPSNVFVTAFAEGLDIIADRARLGPFWTFREFWKDEAKARRKVLDKILHPYVEAAFQKLRAGELDDESKEESTTLLENLVKITNGALSSMYHLHSAYVPEIDATSVHDELINILLAGRDTVSCSRHSKALVLYLETPYRRL
jgi:cytochrome P450